MSSTRLKLIIHPTLHPPGKNFSLHEQMREWRSRETRCTPGRARVRADPLPAQGSFTTALHFSLMGSSDEFYICLVLFHSGGVSPTLSSYDPSLATVPRSSQADLPIAGSARHLNQAQRYGWNARVFDTSPTLGLARALLFPGRVHPA